MFISLLPLQISGAADLEYGNIAISYWQPFRDIIDTLCHELAHLIIRDNNHSNRWLQCYRLLGGSSPLKHGNGSDASIREIIDIGYMPNIGNISGIQNIY